MEGVELNIAWARGDFAAHSVLSDDFGVRLGCVVVLSFRSHSSPLLSFLWNGNSNAEVSCGWKTAEGKELYIQNSIQYYCALLLSNVCFCEHHYLLARRNVAHRSPAGNRKVQAPLLSSCRDQLILDAPHPVSCYAHLVKRKRMYSQRLVTKQNKNSPQWMRQQRELQSHHAETVCLTLAILILVASPIFGALKERRILLFSNGYQMPKVSVLSLQTFVTERFGTFTSSTIFMFVCLRSGRSSPVMQGAWKPSPETLPLQQRKEAGTSRWQFSPAVLKWDNFSARFFLSSSVDSTP